MERYLTIAKVNLKYQFFPHMLAAVLLCILSPLIMGVENLDSYQTAKIIDMFLSVIGIILMVPVFLGDEDKNIRELCYSKKESMAVVHGIRLLESLIVMVVIYVGFLFFLNSRNCEFPYALYLYGAISNGLFVGGIGLFVYAAFDLMPLAYMVPIMYYVVNVGGGRKYLGHFYLFSLMSRESADKIYLLMGGVILTIAAFLIRDCRVMKYKPVKTLR